MISGVLERYCPPNKKEPKKRKPFLADLTFQTILVKFGLVKRGKGLRRSGSDEPVVIRNVFEGIRIIGSVVKIMVDRDVEMDLTNKLTEVQKASTFGPYKNTYEKLKYFKKKASSNLTTSCKPSR